MPPDRDEHIEAIIAANRAMLLAVHRGDGKQIMVQIQRLVTAMIDHRDAFARRDDKALVAAVAKLGKH